MTISPPGQRACSSLAFDFLQSNYSRALNSSLYFLSPYHGRISMNVVFHQNDAPWLSFLLEWEDDTGTRSLTYFGFYIPTSFPPFFPILCIDSLIRYSLLDIPSILPALVLASDPNLPFPGNARGGIAVSSFVGINVWRPIFAAGCRPVLRITFVRDGRYTRQNRPRFALGFCVGSGSRAFRLHCPAGEQRRAQSIALFLRGPSRGCTTSSPRRPLPRTQSNHPHERLNPVSAALFRTTEAKGWDDRSHLHFEPSPPVSSLDRVFPLRAPRTVLLHLRTSSLTAFPTTTPDLLDGSPSRFGLSHAFHRFLDTTPRSSAASTCAVGDTEEYARADLHQRSVDTTLRPRRRAAASSAAPTRSWNASSSPSSAYRRRVRGCLGLHSIQVPAGIKRMIDWCTPRPRTSAFTLSSTASWTPRPAPRVSEFRRDSEWNRRIEADLSLAVGGSTIVLLFEKHVMEWVEDLLVHGRASLKILVRGGMGIGTGLRTPKSQAMIF
ncbi:hypothetical protein B0H16DRAFT_1718510 [Mycena metata]|uniref:Uncharacterized protein n=1 Tax=Mycena metata TaxID=1033252 RepID=A0AAD7NJL2_9AGAR|nr:hypothetical protein B0H16DRAFT_1718510 [Mycena metata]